VKSVLPAKSGFPVFTYMNKTVTTRPVLLPRLLYSRKEAAYQLSISTRSLDYLIAEGRLNTRKIGGRILVPHDELLRFSRHDRMEPMRPDAPQAIAA
jgi:excisionase family DNA binding protein